MNILKGKTGITAVIAVGLVLTSFLVAVKFLSGVVEEHYESVKTVCLDAGHGADDVGATSTGGARLEKDDNLRLTLKVKDRLEAKGIKVILTREDDSDITLKERCKLANRKLNTIVQATTISVNNETLTKELTNDGVFKT